ncbi:MAG: HEAT repeat domain-containing protein [Planctomycetes bacterium]|nr:HEAT repeat domain-containing protein [Planctomycetota bacterium]
MRRFSALAFLAAVGCASGVTREEHDALRKKLDDLEAKVGAHNSKQASLYDAMVEKQELMHKKLNEMDAIVKILETTAKRIEEKLKTTPTGDNTGRGDDPKPADVVTRTSEALLGLKTGKLTVETVVAQLRPVAKDAAPLLADELKRAVTDRQYAGQLVAILSNLPPEAVRIPLAQLLGERGIVRIFAARIVGNLRDKETARILEAHLDTDDEDFRLVVGESLVLCRNAAGIPLLVKCLSSKDFSNRVIAIEVLKRLNKGDDLGYRATKPEENAEAIKKWEGWAETAGKSIFE